MRDEKGAFVYCSCGMANEFIDSPEGGQSLFGTAALRSLSHESTCNGSTKVFPAWRDSDGEIVIMSGKLRAAQQNAVSSKSMYYE